METKNVSVCYIDDVIDPALSKFLSNHFSNYHEIVVNNESVIDVIFKQIRNYKCEIAVIDSKLFDDSSSNNISGEILELLALKNNPKLGVVVVSQNNDIDGYNYVKKVRSWEIKNELPKGATKGETIGKMIEKYEESLLPLLRYYVDRSIRMSKVNDEELQNNSSIDEYTKDIINDYLNDLDSYNVSKDDLDSLFSKFNEIAKYVNK